MRIEDAKRAYSAQLDTLRSQKQTLTKLLKDSENNSSGMQNYDRVEISRELSAIDAEYKATQEVMDGIIATETFIYDSIVARQQSEAAAEGAKEFGKIMTIYRRIASGGEVPSSDERRLMEFSHELYMAAKAAAMMNQDEDEKYDSLWKDDERPKGETESAAEIAGNTEIVVPSPEQIASAVRTEQT